MSFRLIVRGPQSQVGQHLVRLAADRGFELLPWPDSAADNATASLEEAIREQSPHLVINLNCEYSSAAMACLDRLIALSGDLDLPLLHVSSYRVFGLQEPEQAFSEEHLPEPQDDVGRGLCEIEGRVAKISKHMIMRSSWRLEAGMDSLLDAMVPALLNDETLVVSDHHSGGPLSTEFLSRALLAICQQILTGADNWGVFHLHSGDVCSEAEFCDHLVRALKKEFNRDFEFPELATKDDERHAMPGCARLAGRRLTDDFGIQMPTWRRGFTAILRQWLANYESSKDPASMQ